MNPDLDRWLSEQSPKLLRRKRSALRFLREGYTISVSAYTNKVRTDITAQSGGFTSHIGSPLPDLRQLTSWVLTNADSKRSIAKLIPALWRRHGREDVLVAGMFLANLDEDALGQPPWMAFIHLLQRKEPLLVVLEVAEELVRAGHPVPDDAWLDAAAAQSPQWHQYCVLFLSLRSPRSLTLHRLVETAPPGGAIFERIRQRLIQAEG